MHPFPLDSNIHGVAKTKSHGIIIMEMNLNHVLIDHLKDEKKYISQLTSQNKASNRLANCSHHLKS